MAVTRSTEEAYVTNEELYYIRSRGNTSVNGRKHSLAGQKRECTLTSDDLSAPKGKNSKHRLRSGRKLGGNDTPYTADIGTDPHTKNAANNDNACCEDDQKKNDENSNYQSPFKKPKPSGIAHTALTAISTTTTTAATNATTINATTINATTINATAINATAINTTATTDASTTKDSSSNGTDNLDAMWQAVSGEQVVDRRNIVPPPTNAREMKERDRKAVNGVLGMMTTSGESMFQSVKRCPPPPCGHIVHRPKDIRFHEGLRGKMDKVRESMSPEELKKYGRRSLNPPKVCVIRAAGSTGQLEVIAVTTSIVGKPPYAGRVPDGKGGKKWVRAVNGVADPNCFTEKIGGRYQLIVDVKPGQTLENYRGILHVTVHASESDPAVIAAKEKADKNVTLYEDVMKRIRDDRAVNNGLPTGETTQLYQIVPSPNTMNKDPSAENVMKAKARGIYSLKVAINQRPDPSVSDSISRLKKKKGSPFNDDDIDKLLKKNNGSCLLNGWIISKFKDKKAYDAYHVDPGMDFYVAKGERASKKMSPLPKRVKIE